MDNGDSNDDDFPFWEIIICAQKVSEATAANFRKAAEWALSSRNAE